MPSREELLLIYDSRGRCRSFLVISKTSRRMYTAPRLKIITTRNVSNSLFRCLRASRVTFHLIVCAHLYYNFITREKHAFIILCCWTLTGGLWTTITRFKFSNATPIMPLLGSNGKHNKKHEEIEFSLLGVSIVRSHGADNHSKAECEFDWWLFFALSFLFFCRY